MTHDELLAKMDDFNVALSNGFGDVKVIIGSVNAVRAVVELHKPNEQGDCYLCTTEYTVTYPCLTIKAIEKELE